MGEQKKICILLVEDDETIASVLTYALEQEGFRIEWVKNAREAASRIGRTDISLYLLDVLLPDGTGYDLCQKIKTFHDVPVIFLTACDEEADIVKGLDLGADDYIAKPFRVRELISRIHSVRRRYQKHATASHASVLAFENVRVSLKDGKVYRDEVELSLSALEYKMLLYFIQNKDMVVTRDQLLSHIFDIAGEYVNDNTLTVYIKRLREKLEEEPGNPRILKTIRGIGYRLGENRG